MAERGRTLASPTWTANGVVTVVRTLNWGAALGQGVSAPAPEDLGGAGERSGSPGMGSHGEEPGIGIAVGSPSDVHVRAGFP